MDVFDPCFPGFYALLRDFAGPVATIVAASAAVFVTWRLGRAQHRVAADQAKIAQLQADLATVRLQHDLFDRRYEIYEIVFMFIIEIIQRSDMSEEGMRKFVRGMTKAPFLFDQKMTDYFEDLRRQAVYLQEAASFVSDPLVHSGVPPPHGDRSYLHGLAMSLSGWWNGSGRSLRSTKILLRAPLVHLAVAFTTARISKRRADAIRHLGWRRCSAVSSTMQRKKGVSPLGRPAQAGTRRLHPLGGRPRA
jgi:hypothetical protein